MATSISLEQMAVLVAIDEQGSFSGAARSLGKVQSAVSHSVARSEELLGVTIFDRRSRRTLPTLAGQALIDKARLALASAAELTALASSLEGGLEAEVSIVFDAIFPTDALIEFALRFNECFPKVALRLGTETLSAVSRAVERGDYDLGVCGPAAPVSNELQASHIGTVRMIPVAGVDHPLASIAEPLDARTLGRHTQIVLSERGDASVDDVAVISRHTWRVVDLSTKHLLIQRGLGWGNLPEHMARADLGSGDLHRLNIASWGTDEHLLGLRVVRLVDQRPGPAIAWVVERLPELCQTWREQA